MVVELSTDRAVGTASVPRPGAAAPTPSAVEILGSGSFGTAEGAPVGWVAVWVGSGVTSVTLSEGGQVTDSMAPESGVAVLALPGDATLAGATVVGYDQSGAAVSTVPLTQAPVTEDPAVCAGLPTTSPPSSVPVTTPSTPANVPTPVQSPPTLQAP
jgi:hypothetical protein